jgi:tight adherence protein B
VLGVLLGVAAAGTASIGASYADASPVNVTITSPQLAGGVLTGELTLRSGGVPVAADAGSLHATIDGKAYAVTTTTADRPKRATMLVVDTSGSMGPQGMATVRQAVKAFLAEAPKDVAVGLISFAGTAGVDVPPTTNRSQVQAAVNGLVAQGETTLYDAMSLAGPAMAAYQDRSLVLLSDGGDTRSKATRAGATTSLQKYGVRAEIIGFNTADSDNTVLAGFAKAGGGTLAPASNATAVKAAFEDAARTLDTQTTFTINTGAVAHGNQKVLLSGTAGGVPFIGTTTVDFGAAPVVPSTVAPTTPAPPPVAVGKGPSATLVAPQGMPASLIAAMATVVLGLLVLVGALFAPAFRSGRSQRVDSIERYVTPGVAMTTDARAMTATSLASSLISVGDRVMEGRESTSKTMSLIDRADLPLRAGEWWVLRLVALVIGIAGGLVLLRGGILVTIFALLVGSAFGWFAPAFVLRFLAKRRSKKFETQLPDVLTLVASSLSTGFSLLQALDAVSKDAAEPSAKEFSRALAETRIGADVGEALEHMAARMQSDNMKWTSMAIRIQREVGGNLAETLRTTAKTLREREELARHVRALSAEGRLSAYILMALPIGIFFYSMMTNRDYVSLLWTRALGMAMLGGGIISLGIGWAWMRKVVDVKV